MQQDHLIMIEDDKGRREFTLENSMYSIGRDPKCDIQLISLFVSRRHATLVQLPSDTGDGFYYRIVDGNLKGKTSSNGLIINGTKEAAHDLHDEDKIVFGPGVTATYYLIDSDARESRSGPIDDFDITLISPSMMPDDDEEGAGLPNS